MLFRRVREGMADPLSMNPDDDVCLCFHVPLRKLRAFMAREKPVVASQLSECLGAGTGCQWCVPFLCRLHAQHLAGELPDLPMSPEEYSQRRARYRAAGRVRGEGDLPRTEETDS